MLSNDKIDPRAIKDLARGALDNLPVFYFDEIDSTNEEAKRKVYSDGLTTGLFIADRQTRGKGRRGHSFYSPKDSGIYMTYVFTPEEGISAGTHVTTKTGVCVAKALEKLYGLSPSIKWVNDIYIGSKKVCGILAEAVIGSELNKGTIVVGIGINLHTEDFPEDISEIAGSVTDDMSVTRNAVIAEVIGELDKETASINDISYLDYYRSHSMLADCDITYYEGEILKTAHVTGIDDEAGLMVRLPDGTETVLRNGEVFTIRKKDS